MLTPARKTIAVVDDDELIRESLGALLEAYGYAVQGFATGPEFLAAQLPDGSCVLLDVKMPHCSGLEVLDRLRRRGPGVPPVILITGGLPPQLEGASACLRKPIRPQELLAEIDRAFAAP
jgi:two-component system, LuxR family, response regulator FixJ